MPLYTRSRSLRRLEAFTPHKIMFPPESLAVGSSIRAHFRARWISFSELGGTTCSLSGGAVAVELVIADVRDRRLVNGAEESKSKRSCEGDEKKP